MSRSGWRVLLAPEAWPYAVLVLLTVLAYQISIWPRTASLAWLGAGFLLYLLKQSQRQSPALPLAVLSPVDGRMQAIEQSFDPYLNRSALRVRLTQRWFGEFGLFNPADGQVHEIWGPSGQDGSARAGRYAYWIRTDGGDNIVIAVQCSRRFGRTRFRFQAGERLGQGQNCGWVGFGVDVELYLASDSLAMVTDDAAVRGGISVVAGFKRDGA